MICHIICQLFVHLVNQAVALANRGGLRDLETVRKFIRGSMTEAFEKVLTDPAITGWPENLQLQTFDAVTALVDLTAAKLMQLNAPEGTDAAQAIEDEADSMALLEPLMHAFDTNSMYNFKNADCMLPAKMPRELPSRYARPHLPETPAVLLTDPTESDVQDCSHFETFSWPAYFINYFGHRKGFLYIRQVRLLCLKLAQAKHNPHLQTCCAHWTCSVAEQCHSSGPDLHA